MEYEKALRHNGATFYFDRIQIENTTAFLWAGSRIIGIVEMGEKKLVLNSTTSVEVVNKKYLNFKLQQEVKNEYI